MAACSRIPAWRIPWTEAAWRAIVHGVAESDMTERMYACVAVGVQPGLPLPVGKTEGKPGPGGAALERLFPCCSLCLVAQPPAISQPQSSWQVLFPSTQSQDSRVGSQEPSPQRVG